MRGLHWTPLWLALVSTTVACGDATADTDADGATDADPPFDAGICGRYIECVVASAEIVPGLESTYGENGSCWSEFDATVCWDTCQRELTSLRERHPNEMACTECRVDSDCAWLPGSCDADVCVSSGDEGDETAAPTLNGCGLSMVAPEVTNPIIAGDEAGLLPSQIGDALERNCGCHYTSSASSPYIPFQGGTQLQTLTNFRNPYNGANSQYAGLAAYEVVFDRVVRLRDMPMALCETTQGTSITDADLALFTAWLEQDAPDGASFTPP